MAKTLDEAGVKRLIQEIKGANKNLNIPIPISTENTPESMAQNVKNIADYVEKAKAAGIANVYGMAVTCSIDEGYSGVGSIGCLPGNIEIFICGIITYDGNPLENPTFFVVDPDGTYRGNNVLIEHSKDIITSDMLVEGARRPIIITGDMTEVDEETYQKLLSDDVDVVFKDATDVFNILYDRVISETTITLTFVSVTCSDTTDASSYVFSRFPIVIDKAAPHTLQVSGPAENNLEEILNGSNYLNKSTLSPVLQEIDLTGTDAERKAKLDQFETNWKALTGAIHLAGARFIGLIDNGGGAQCLLSYNEHSGYYSGISAETADNETLIKIQVSPNTGSIIITPLFSHLEAITIKTNNSTASKVANVAAIKAYVDNLIALGVDTTKGYMIPIKTSSLENIVGFIIPNMKDTGYVGLGEIANGHGINLFISNDGTFYNYALQDQRDPNLTTTSKFIVSSINEVNALAKGYSTIFTPIELTTETAQNKTAIDARVAAFTAQGISLTNGCCIPVTYKGVYAGNISLINGDWYGLLVKNTNNPADNINIKLSADGTITEGNSAQ